MQKYPPSHSSEQLYSRQCSTYGARVMSQLSSLRIHMIGTGPLAFECGKNLVLSGVQCLTIEDDPNDPVRICTMHDVATNFACTHAHVRESTLKTKVLVDALHAIQPHADIRSRLPYGAMSTWELPPGTDVLIVATDAAHGSGIKTSWSHWNALCRTQHVWFIGGLVTSRAAVCWQDPGERHHVWDADGERNRSMMILHASPVGESSSSRVTVGGAYELNLDLVQHHLAPGDHITSAAWPAHTPPARVRQVQQQKIVAEFDHVVEPATLVSQYVERVPHAADIVGLPLAEYLEHEFDAAMSYHHYGKLSHPERCRTLWQHFWRDDAPAARDATDFLPAYHPLVCQLGGIMAQEALKRLGKFTPFVGALYSDSYECGTKLPCTATSHAGGHMEEHSAEHPGAVPRVPRKPIGDWIVFVVGAGALGCEILKNLAVQGFGTGAGRIIVTDMDSIELSNLSRQFLYRDADIGKMKATVAAEAIRAQRGTVEVVPYTIAVGKDTETIFHHYFWESLDVVINALDNVEARLFVDRQCAWHRKPLFESGTLGMKGNVQVVLPHATQMYADSRDPPVDEVPVCTIKHFPFRIEHCLQWAREMFADVFGTSTQAPHTENKMQDPLQCGTQWFITDIVQQQEKHPRDSLNDDGTTPFWSGARRYPHPCTDAELAEWRHSTNVLVERIAALSGDTRRAGIEFEKDDDTNGHINWILHTANLRAQNYGIPPCDRTSCKEIAGNITPAVASTTSVVVGFVMDEVMKYICGAHVSAQYNTFLNLGLSTFLMAEPAPPIVQRGKAWDNELGCPTRTLLGEEFTCWDRLVLYANELRLQTVGDMCRYFETAHGVEVTTLYTPTEIYYSDVNPKTTDYLQTILPRTADDGVYRISIDAEDDAETNILIPTVEVYWSR